MFALSGGDEKPGGGAEKVEGVAKIFEFRFWILDLANRKRVALMPSSGVVLGCRACRVEAPKNPQAYRKDSHDEAGDRMRTSLARVFCQCGSHREAKAVGWEENNQKSKNRSESFHG
jgi:hypothetical protein